MMMLLLLQAPHRKRFADQGAKPAGFFPVIGINAAPGHEGWQGAFVAAPQRNERPGRQNPPDSGIYRPISRLEPDCDLGQKGALPPGMAAVFGW